MRIRVFGLLALLALGCLPLAAGELPPPFGLSWGGSPGRLVDWSKRFELDLLVKAPGKAPEKSILFITPGEGSLPGGHEASSLEARFIEGRLFEVVVHYTYPGRSTGFVKGRFSDLKKIFSASHGEFKMSARQKAIKDGISTTSDAYHLEPYPGFLLMMAHTVVTDVQRGDSAARFSVVYHCDRILREQRKEAAALKLKPEPIRLPERK